MSHNIKEFKPTSWSINNSTSVYIITALIVIMGLMSYNSLPKEKFPEIVIPTIYVNTVYFGTSPIDMENLVTRPIEKKLKGVNGIKKITSQSFDGVSVILVEFNTGIAVPDAKQKVKDAVDKARPDLPTKLTQDPTVQEVDFSEFPIMFVNLSGDFELDRLKKFGDNLKDRIEALKQITRVDIVGAPTIEVKVDVDLYKLAASQVAMSDVINAIQYENLNISGGDIDMDAMKRTISVKGQFKSIDEIQNVIVSTTPGGSIRLGDIADVSLGHADRESYARLEGKNVITLNVIKRSGENLIESSDKIQEIIADMQKTHKLPESLKVTVTGDQSTTTRHTLDDLINSIIIGFVLVLVILMFFMGVTNAFFVALSVPLSVFVTFLFLPSLGFTLNMIVLFSMLFGIGIIVDDAIVVIENTHRIFNKAKGKKTAMQAAKEAAGEVFIPVFSGTLTTVAPFIPLAFWPGIIGKFLYFLPITFMVTLMASLLVAFVINPVFAVDFMDLDDHHAEEVGVKKNKGKTFRIWLSVLGSIALLCYLGKNFGLGNFALFLIGCMYLNKYVLKRAISNFQQHVIPAMRNGYEKVIHWALSGWNPGILLLSTLGLLIFSFVFVGIRKPPVVFFPGGDPNFVYVYIKTPTGTDIYKTDSITRIVEKKVQDVLGPNNPDVDAIQSNVAIGAGDQNDRINSTNKGKVSVVFKEFQFRKHPHTQSILDSIRAHVKGIPGVEITVDKESNGPPVGKPINIEVSSENLDALIHDAEHLKKFIDSLQVPGVEKLKSDLDKSNPELAIDLDREHLKREGLSTGQVGTELRNAVFGNEASKYKLNEDEYKIMVRAKPEQRTSIDALMNMKITFRDMGRNMGQIRQVPLASVATVRYSSSFGGINRLNLKRVVTISSNVLSGYTPNDVNANLKSIIDANFKFSDGVTYKQTGEGEDQAETSAFLGKAGLIAIMLIFLILALQFNSLTIPLIVISEIIFSIIGVLLGFGATRMSISIVMTGMGIVGLAGIVVKNGILLIEFAEVLRSRGVELRDAVILAGRTRLTPVLLTASATITALIPLGIGFNIDFVRLFTEGNPHIYVGGDSVVFWGPMSWTIIFGLSFATFLTLVLVPVMYYLRTRLRTRLIRRFNPQYVDPKDVKLEGGIANIEDLI